MAPGGMTPGDRLQATDFRCEPSSGAGRHFPMSFPGALLPTCEQVDPLCKGGRGTEHRQSRGLCYHVRLRGPAGSAAAGAANPVKQRWPEAGPRGRPEGGQRLARGVGWRGAQPVGGHHGGPGGQSGSPTPPGRTTPKGRGASQSPTMWEILTASYGVAIATTFFKKYPAFYCMLDVVRLTSSFPAPTRRKGKESCPAPWHFLINVN